jgi:hypothetical protein
MTAGQEKDKFAERGQEITSAEAALEDAREAWHSNKDDEGLKLQFKAAQEAVVGERVMARRAREAEPPPTGSTPVRDATGKVYGWTTPAGDAVSAQGGRQG